MGLETRMDLSSKKTVTLALILESLSKTKMMPQVSRSS